MTDEKTLANLSLDVQVELRQFRKDKTSPLESLEQLAQEIKRRLDSAKNGMIFDYVVRTAIMGVTGQKGFIPSATAVYGAVKNLYKMMNKKHEMTEDEAETVRSFCKHYHLILEEKLERAVQKTT